MARGTKGRGTAKRPRPAEDWSNAIDLVPPRYTERCREFVTRTDAVCDARLNAEYKVLCRKMAAAICQGGPLVLGGKPEGWVAGIVYALGKVNFLTDPSQKPHLNAADIASVCGVSQATMMNRARLLREGLELMPLHPDWCLPSRLDDNPLVWMMEVNGFMVDIRAAPRELQEVAFEQGLIPYIPADREENGG